MPETITNGATVDTRASERGGHGATEHSRSTRDVRSDGQLPSPETLQLVADETRLTLLWTLWTAEESPLGFTALRRRAGADDSARFNYHLQQLVGTFVRSAEGGYALTERGERFVAALT